MSKISLKHSGGNVVSLNSPTSAPTSSDVAFKLPNADGSANQVIKTDGSGNLAFVAQSIAGITEFDHWYMTSNKSDNTDITANLARNNQAGAASYIGNGMSESSGIFTFGATGKYLVICAAQFQIKDYDNCNIATKVTTNNSTYNQHTMATDGNNGSGSRGGSGVSYAFIDVTDTSQVKVKFTVGSLNTDSYVVGGGSQINTSFLFIRIGDT